jgi:hypothetical protein
VIKFQISAVSGILKAGYTPVIKFQISAVSGILNPKQSNVMIPNSSLVNVCLVNWGL